MIKLCAIFGSPRRKGNTSLLLRRSIDGARDAGAEVNEIILRDKKFSPCLEIYGCKNSGQCVIRDDFHEIVDQMLESQGVILASPIFFYSVSAHTKMLIDRCQSLWMKKYYIEKADRNNWVPKRKGLFISLGATKGKKLFDGPLLTIRYFFDVLDMTLHKSLLYRGIDLEGEINDYPEYLEEAYQAGKDLVKAIEEM
ncbi:MAG: flavodoxin family protein [Deltaproteobacteria bacterium]|nr:flavodoxin family protein [Deltaproteobacteria bacterium]